MNPQRGFKLSLCVQFCVIYYFYLSSSFANTPKLGRLALHLNCSTRLSCRSLCTSDPSFQGSLPCPIIDGRLQMLVTTDHGENRSSLGIILPPNQNYRALSMTTGISRLVLFMLNHSLGGITIENENPLPYFQL